jgi:hypothetical protein
VTRFRVHIVRFAVLATGLFVGLAVFFPLFACLRDDTGALDNVLHCPGVVVVYWYVFGSAFLPIYLVPAMALACAGTLFWALFDRNRS